jgi:cytochrome c biogenesis protein CcdA/thiol-disulfide isomerase/thioredoxin
MILLLVAYFGGVLTILSPCILPVVPFVFARAGGSFWRNGAPLFAGMAMTFAFVASIASIGGGWVVRANAYGRDAALIVLGIFGVTLLLPRVAEWVMRPFVRAGNALTRLSHSASGSAGSFAVGVATGLLWAPCAGPILGLVLAGAALSGGRAWTTLLLLAYALGAATSLGIALFAGRRVVDAIKRSFGLEELLRRVAGVLVLLCVFVIAFGLDHGILTKISAASTNALESGLIARLESKRLPTAQGLPALPGAADWVNTPPLTAAALHGHVLLVDFWTYSCINCLRSLPYVEAWAERYRPLGLIVLGIHTPEFAFERERGNVAKAIRDLGIDYPVALDNEYAVWNAFHNEYWPAHYLIDRNGAIRYHHFGEGAYDETEAAIRGLLATQGGTLPAPVSVAAAGIEKAADDADLLTPEIYLGLARRQGYRARSDALRLNQWSLTGDWRSEPERVVTESAGADLFLRFHARDAHIVLGPPNGGRSGRFTVTLDGEPPGSSAGVDVNAHGDGVVAAHRLYGLIRQKGAVRDHLLRVHFLAPGTQAYSMTFG